MSQLITDVRALDNLDDRREVWHLLHRLRPVDRFRFLRFLSRQVYLPGSKIHPAPSWLRMTPRIKAAQRGDDEQDRALTNEIYMDVWHLTMQYGLSAKFAATALEEAVRRGLKSIAIPACSRIPCTPGSAHPSAEHPERRS